MDFSQIAEIGKVALSGSLSEGFDIARLLRDNPELAYSILTNVKSVTESKAIRIPESVLETFLVEQMREYKSETIKDVACCGLASNRLLIVGVLQKGLLTYDFRLEIQPAAQSIVWESTAKGISFEVKGPVFNEHDIQTRVVSGVSQGLLTFLLPGIANAAIGFVFEKFYEIFTQRTLSNAIKAQATSSVIPRQGSLFVDMHNLPWIGGLCKTSVRMPATGTIFCLGDYVRPESLVFDRDGALVRVFVDPEASSALDKFTSFISGIYGKTT